MIQSDRGRSHPYLLNVIESRSKVQSSYTRKSHQARGQRFNCPTMDGPLLVSLVRQPTTPQTQSLKVRDTYYAQSAYLHMQSKIEIKFAKWQFHLLLMPSTDSNSYLVSISHEMYINKTCNKRGENKCKTTYTLVEYQQGVSR